MLKLMNIFYIRNVVKTYRLANLNIFRYRKPSGMLQERIKTQIIFDAQKPCLKL